MEFRYSQLYNPCAQFHVDSGLYILFILRATIIKNAFVLLVLLKQFFVDPDNWYIICNVTLLRTNVVKWLEPKMNKPESESNCNYICTVYIRENQSGKFSQAWFHYIWWLFIKLCTF